MVDYFNRIFHGNGSDGLILRERWIARDGLFERLSEHFRMAVFTGRLRWEAELTLKRCAPHLPSLPSSAADDVTRPKPAPEGLLKICAQASAQRRAGTSAIRSMTPAAHARREFRSSASPRPRIRATTNW